MHCQRLTRKGVPLEFINVTNCVFAYLLQPFCYKHDRYVFIDFRKIYGLDHDHLLPTTELNVQLARSYKT